MPEMLHGSRQLFGTVEAAEMLPMLRIQVGVARTRETLVHQQDNTHVLGAADQPASRLEDIV